MPSRIQICKDKDEALRMGEAGLLMFRVSRDRWAPCAGEAADRVALVYAYWPHSCFGYLVEDE